MIGVGDIFVSVSLRGYCVGFNTVITRSTANDNGVVIFHTFSVRVSLGII